MQDTVSNLDGVWRVDTSPPVIRPKCSAGPAEPSWVEAVVGHERVDDDVLLRKEDGGTVVTLRPDGKLPKGAPDGRPEFFDGIDPRRGTRSEPASDSRWGWHVTTSSGPVSGPNAPDGFLFRVARIGFHGDVLAFFDPSGQPLGRLQR